MMFAIMMMMQARYYAIWAAGENGKSLCGRKIPDWFDGRQVKMVIRCDNISSILVMVMMFTILMMMLKMTMVILKMMQILNKQSNIIFHYYKNISTNFILQDDRHLE